MYIRACLKCCVAILCVVLLHVSGLAQDRALINTSKSPHARLQCVDLDAVRWTSGFWAEKNKIVSDVAIPYMRTIFMNRALQNFKVAAGLEEGDFYGSWWHDGDLYKWFEALAYTSALSPSEELTRQMSEIIDIIAQAQRADGYLHTSILIGHGTNSRGRHFEGKTTPFADPQDHELYNMGHLMTAAAVHYRSTGDDSFLKVAEKTADYLYSLFKNPEDDHLRLFPSNPSIVMGMVELYRTTGNKKHLELADIFMTNKGAVEGEGYMQGGTDHLQDRTPLREEREAVGHAVRANYLYAGATDLYAETGEEAIWTALLSIWDDVTYRKMHVTGGTGAHHFGITSASDQTHESYGRAFELPNATGYMETCANIANGMWNWRMFLITGEARFADVMELVYYNSGISGFGTSGTDFLYTNPLRWYGGDHSILFTDSQIRWNVERSGICCPPNLVRTIAEMNSYAYSVSEKGLWINLYGSNTLETELQDGSQLRLAQETDYPWDGAIALTIKKAPVKELALLLRIPGWAGSAAVKVNGKTIAEGIRTGQYYEVKRSWKAGDRLELNLPMPVQLIEGNPLIEEVRNHVAVKRGPVVYCLESHDLPPGKSVSEVVIPEDMKLEVRHDLDLMMIPVTVLQGTAFFDERQDWSHRLYQPAQRQALTDINIKMIPYFAWNNRGVSEMSVWLPVAYR
jgi:DUF1680 family protein